MWLLIVLCLVADLPIIEMLYQDVSIKLLLIMFLKYNHAIYVYCVLYYSDICVCVLFMVSKNAWFAFGICMFQCTGTVRPLWFAFSGFWFYYRYVYESIFGLVIYCAGLCLILLLFVHIYWCYFNLFPLNWPICCTVTCFCYVSVIYFLIIEM
jgi:hypothetical protein